MIQVVDQQIVNSLPLLGQEEKNTILGFIKTYLKLKEEPYRISKEAYNKEIDEAMARMNAGEFITHEDVLKESESW